MLEPFLRHWATLEVEPDQSLTLLLSGGGDSVALFHLLVGGQLPFSVLHFFHDSPGCFAQQSRDFCQKLCQDAAINIEVVSVEANQVVAGGDLSWEAAARRLRYQNLDSRDPGELFLTAHTADDQAETLVMRLLDGSALAGLAGIRQRLPSLLRPLLPFRRAELREFLQSQDLGWLEDPSNQAGNDRALLRNQIMPTLERHEPSLVGKVGRTARRLASDEDALTGFALDWLANHTLEGDSWPLPELCGLHRAVRYRVLREIWRRSGPPERRPLGGLFEELERLILKGGDDRKVGFPGGGCLRRLGQRLWLEPALGEAQWECPLAEKASGFFKVGPLPGEPDQGRLSVNIPPPLEGSELILRSRRAGDRYRGKDLRKVLAATGHPPWVRDRWPLLVSKSGEILALPGTSGGSEGLDKGKWVLSFWPELLRAEVAKPQKDELFGATEKDY